MPRNWERAAMRFASAKYDNRQGMLDLTFENGDQFLLAIEAVLPRVNSVANRRPGTPAASSSPVAPNPDWARMRIGETGDVLEVPAIGTIIEIPWDRIRSLADPEFRAHLSDFAVERAHRVGTRLRAMRREAKLTRVALAAKVGVTREVISNLEAGRGEPAPKLIQNLAAALGKRLDDFARE